jgi:drug/metabolite transporter (DMT)-like permease
MLIALYLISAFGVFYFLKTENKRMRHTGIKEVPVIISLIPLFNTILFSLFLLHKIFISNGKD